MKISSNTNCPCDSGTSYGACCGQFITGLKTPKTAKELMRSRYTAYATGDTHYLKETSAGPAGSGFDAVEIVTWLSTVTFTGLTVLSAKETGNMATVMFVAHYIERNEKQQLVENSIFKRINGEWVYWDTHSAP